MDLNTIVYKLSCQGPINPVYLKDVGAQLSQQTRDGKLKIIDLVQALDPVLTNGTHDIRQRGLTTLSQVITSLDHKCLNEKEIQVLSEFVCLRLVDHESMEIPALQCLSYFIDCENKPLGYNNTLIEFLKTKTNVQRMNRNSRIKIYRILRSVIIERRRREMPLDSDLVYSTVHLIEGESDPENLLMCFGIISYILKNFENLEAYVDDLFEWLSSYYPIDYTPNDSNSKILKDDLVEALYDCFYANELNAENLQTLLLEKLESTLLSTKLESLKCFVKCYEVFPLASVKSYASSLWTCIRVDCLRKPNMVDVRLLDASYKALSALSAKLSEDEHLYFNFLSDIYEGLSMAFRKPELKLFGPSSGLMACVAQPQVRGFNYILSRMLPVSINAACNDEYRLFNGLAHVFKVFSKHHHNSKLDHNLDDDVNRVAIMASKPTGDCLGLLRALLQCKVILSVNTQDKILETLMLNIDENRSSIEECLTLLSANYNRSDIIFNGKLEDSEVETLMKNISFFEKEVTSKVIQFSIYLQQLKASLNLINFININKIDLSITVDFLTKIRIIAIKLKEYESVITNIGILHFIVINKLENSKVDSVVMPLFLSNYCQKLIPIDDTDETISLKVFLPIINWTFKSLTMRDHQLSMPFINLILNFITSTKISKKLALQGTYTFDFVISNKSAELLGQSKTYQVFALYKQKFYAQTSKHIQMRYEIQEDEFRKYCLLCALASQIRHVQPNVYRRNYEWLLRELIRMLSNFKDQLGSEDSCVKEEIITVIYECLDILVEKKIDDSLHGLLSTLVDLSLFYAEKAKTMLVRQTALNCLSVLASLFDNSELLNMRQTVINKLKLCLSDKKRLVRQSAARARLNWVLIGQPIGS